MQVKTQKQVTVLQNKAQKVADKLNEEVIVIAKGVQHIQVQAGTAYQLNAKDFDAKKSSLIAKKVGDDLEVALEEGVIIFDNYFAVCATDLSCLVSLPTEDGGLYHIVADASFTLEDGTQIVYFYGDRSIVSTESSAVSTDDKQSFLDVVTSNIEVIAAVVVAAVVIASNSGNDGDDGDGDGDNVDDKLSFTFKETGLANNDGVTNDNAITVNGLKEGETWEYSINSGGTFISGTGRSFTLNDGTYSINTIQIRRTDDVSNVSKNTSPIVIDTTDPTFGLQPTAIKVDVNTPITTTVYDAQATNLNSGNADEGITYRIKGTNANKFAITTDTGILTYKTIQALAHDNDTVIIVATDVAGNEAEQPITVSVKMIGLSTSVVWSGIGDDNKLNASEMAATTLSGTVAIIGTVTSINISSIVFKQGNTTVHTISNNLPSVNASDNTWTLANNNTWTSKLTQGDYTVTVNLSGNGNSVGVTGLSSITTAVDTVKPAQPAFDFVDTGLLKNDGITNNGLITINNLEMNATWQYSVNNGNDFVNGTGSSFTLADNATYAANAIQVRQTDAVGNVSDIGKNTLRIVVDNANPIFNLQPTAINVNVNTPITTTVYDAQATNLSGGTVDEDITYRIKGTNADNFRLLLTLEY
jgi:hypothetical protein